MAVQFAVRGDYIQLDQLLKAAGLVDSGGAAHAAVEQGQVRVDGAVESRKRAKLRPGQRVRFAAVDLAGARQALAEREAQWTAWVAEIACGLPNPQALYNDLSSVWTDDDESDAGNTIATLTTEKSA